MKRSRAALTFFLGSFAVALQTVGFANAARGPAAACPPVHRVCRTPYAGDCFAGAPTLASSPVSAAPVEEPQADACHPDRLAGDLDGSGYDCFGNPGSILVSRREQVALPIDEYTYGPQVVEADDRYDVCEDECFDDTDYTCGDYDCYLDHCGLARQPKIHREDISHLAADPRHSTGSQQALAINDRNDGLLDSTPGEVSLAADLPPAEHLIDDLPVGEDLAGDLPPGEHLVGVLPPGEILSPLGGSDRVAARHDYDAELNDSSDDDVYGYDAYGYEHPSWEEEATPGADATAFGAPGLDADETELEAAGLPPAEYPIDDMPAGEHLEAIDADRQAAGFDADYNVESYGDYADREPAYGEDGATRDEAYGDEEESAAAGDNGYENGGYQNGGYQYGDYDYGYENEYEDAYGSRYEDDYRDTADFSDVDELGGGIDGDNWNADGLCEESFDCGLSPLSAGDAAGAEYAMAAATRQSLRPVLASTSWFLGQLGEALLSLSKSVAELAEPTATADHEVGSELAPELLPPTDMGWPWPDTIGRQPGVNCPLEL